MEANSLLIMSNLRYVSIVILTLKRKIKFLSMTCVLTWNHSLVCLRRSVVYILFGT